MIFIFLLFFRSIATTFNNKFSCVLSISATDSLLLFTQGSRLQLLLTIKTHFYPSIFHYFQPGPSLLFEMYPAVYPNSICHLRIADSMQYEGAKRSEPDGNKTNYAQLCHRKVTQRFSEIASRDVIGSTGHDGLCTQIVSLMKNQYSKRRLFYLKNSIHL